ncbi:MAG: protein O-mannosyl-transferase family [Hyphomicrobiales bacterium]
MTLAAEPSSREGPAIARGLPVLAGLAAFAFYLQLIPMVSGFGDGPEFTVVLAKAGLSHPTGYPLYTILGHFFVTALHAIGVPWAFAANAWSGAGAATAVALFVALARRLAALGPPATPAPGGPASAAALFLAAILAVHPALIAEATQAEVNAWSVAWTCAAALVFLRLIARPLTARGAFAWGLIAGVGIAHHFLSLPVTLPLTMALGAAAARTRSLRPRAAVAAIVGGLLPVASYGFLVWRVFHPAPGQWTDVPRTAAGIFEHLTGARYRVFLGSFAPDAHNAEMLAWCVYPIVFPGVVLLLLGLLRSRDAVRRLAWGGLAAGTLLTMGFVFRYGVPDPTPYFLPVVALGLLGAAPPAAALARRLADAPIPARSLAALLAVAAIAFFGAQGVGQSSREKRQLASFDRMVRMMWASVPAESSIVVYPADQHRRLVEYQVLDGEKRAVYVTNLDRLLEPETRAEIERRFGVDPMAGEPIPDVPEDPAAAARVQEEFLIRVVRDLNARVRVPVIVFDPTVPMVQELKKSGA